MPAVTSPSVPQKRKQPLGKVASSPSKKPTPAPDKSKAKANGSILSFFKKTDSFNGGRLGGGIDKNFFLLDEEDVDDDLYKNATTGQSLANDLNEKENNLPLEPSVLLNGNKTKSDENFLTSTNNSKNNDEKALGIKDPGCSPPPPDVASGNVRLDVSEIQALVGEPSTQNSSLKSIVMEGAFQNSQVGDEGKGKKSTSDQVDVVTSDAPCPFALDEDEDTHDVTNVALGAQKDEPSTQPSFKTTDVSVKEEIEDSTNELLESSHTALKSEKVTLLPIKVETVSLTDEIMDNDFIEDNTGDLLDPEQDHGKWEDDDIEDDGEVGEEMINRRFMEENLSDDEELEAALNGVEIVKTESSKTVSENVISCPICSVSLNEIKDDDATRHVNACLDGKPIPLPKQAKLQTLPRSNATPSGSVQRAPQASPFTSLSNIKGSAFSKLMSSHAEDRAWANAAAAHEAARGKRNFERQCPFYKILPNLNVAVDAFRYGAVEGMNAYFLSHFHSDHYIGLSASWCHGPIYCSRITANLCRRQLRVDPKWIVELEYEVKTDVSGTGGATVTMLDANHCPGSSLFLLEKDIPDGRGRKRRQRILHCGDFRAHAKHLRHPLLSVLKGNKIDICYLDTTYMNPKYAFPPQKQVIEVCAELCVSLARDIPDENDMFEKQRREAGITKFAIKNTEKSDGPIKEPSKNENTAVDASLGGRNRGRLLIVVGTYSIGKERICMGIAEALDCKIYAPPNKQKICAALENLELSARLTTDPYAAQVHMTPLMEIRAETLKDYLQDYKPRFSRIVGFRPSGWNYRPPNSRFTESPTVQTVLNSPHWRSDYHISQMFPQRGSTTEAKCFGVPYSEHSSFRELTTFCCALDIVKIVPTVNVGNAKMREKMKVWFEKWTAEKKKNGFYQLEDGRETL